MNNELMIIFLKHIEKKTKNKVKVNRQGFWEDIAPHLSNINANLANNVTIAADYFLLKEGWAVNADMEMIPAVINGDNARVRFSDGDAVMDVIFSSSPVFTKIVWLSIPIARAKRFFGIDLNLDIVDLLGISDIDKRDADILSVLKDVIVKRPDFGEDLILEYLPTNAYIIAEKANAISIEKLDIYNTEPRPLPFSDVCIKNKVLRLVYCTDFAAELTVDEVPEIKDDIRLTCKLFRKDGKRSLIF